MANNEPIPDNGYQQPNAGKAAPAPPTQQPAKPGANTWSGWVGNKK